MLGLFSLRDEFSDIWDQYGSVKHKIISRWQTKRSIFKRWVYSHWSRKEGWIQWHLGPIWIRQTQNHIKMTNKTLNFQMLGLFSLITRKEGWIQWHLGPNDCDTRRKLNECKNLTEKIFRWRILEQFICKVKGRKNVIPYYWRFQSELHNTLGQLKCQLKQIIWIQKPTEPS